MPRPRVLALGLVLVAAHAAAQPARRPLILDDYARVVTPADPQRSPDGEWVAYTVTTIDAAKDRRNTDL